MEFIDLIQIVLGALAGGGAVAGGAVAASRGRGSAPSGGAGEVDLERERERWEAERRAEEEKAEQAKEDLREIIRTELEEALQPNTMALERLASVLSAIHSTTGGESAPK